MMTILISMILFFSLNSLAGGKKNEEFTKEMYTCFNIREIEVNVEYDRIQWSPNEKFTDVCIFGLHISSNDLHYHYSTRRWRSPAYCKKFIKEWKELKKGKRKVCISSYLSSPEKTKYKGKEVLEQSGFWEEIKSGNWCHTYFVGNCQGITHRSESF